jgi:hypothetical protein
MGCGCGCNKPPKGNFTYIRYASDANGSDFAKDKTEGAIERCWQAFVVSPIALDEESISFQNLFNGLWFDTCAECSCGCVWHPYNVPNGDGVPPNRWSFLSNTSPSVSFDATVSNGLLINKMVNGDEMKLLPTFKDNDDVQLVSGTTYCLEYSLELIVGGGLSDEASVELSFGDGPLATVLVFDSTSPLTGKLEFTAQDGAGYIASELKILCKTLSGGTSTLEMNFDFTNFRVGPKECCNEGIDPVEEAKTIVPPMQVKVTVKGPRNNSYSNFLADQPLAEGGLPSSFLFTDVLEVRWDTDCLGFLNRNPEIWLFQWKHSRKKKYFEEGTLDEHYRVIEKRAFKHPVHQDGTKHNGSNQYSGLQSYKVRNGDTFITKQLRRDTEFPITPRGEWGVIDFEPHTFFRGFEGGDWDKGNPYNDELNSVRGNRNKSGGAFTRGEAWARFKLAIVVDSDRMNGSVTNPQPEKIIGEMSQEFYVERPKRVFGTFTPQGQNPESYGIARFRYKIGHTTLNRRQ